jgi:hypothetical protein
MEPVTNVRLIHRDCGPKPVGYAGNPLDLSGAYVKLQFVGINDRIEHMWIHITEVNVESKTITGTLNNDPYLCLDLKEGDLIKDRRIEEIEAVEF